MIDLFKNRNFVLLWVAQVVSGVGDTLYHVGVMVTIFQRTGSALQTVGATVALSLPAILAGSFAGSVVDRYPRRRILIAMDFVRALLVATLLFLLGGDSFNLWALYLVVGGLSLATTFYEPARQAMIPSLVTRDQLVQANSLLIGTNQATLAAGFLMGSILILAIPLKNLVIVNCITFLFAAVIITFIRGRQDEHSEDAERGEAGMFQSVGEGLAYLRDNALARPLIVMEVLENVPHGIWSAALVLVFVERALDGNATTWGLLASAYFGGKLLGALVAAFSSRFISRSPGQLIIGNAFAFGILTAVFALSPMIAVAVAFVFGPPSSLRDVAQDSLLQTSSPENLLGRVYAMRDMFASFSFILGSVVFAWLADAISIRAIYLIGAGLYLGTALYALSRRSLRRAGECSALDANDAFCRCLKG